MGKHKLTLDEAWVECIKMWEWIVKHLAEANTTELKRQYVEKFWPKLCGFLDLDCYFCAYSNQQTQTCFSCDACPGQLVDPSFHCCNNEYSYNDNPRAFLAKIKELHKIYLKEQD